MMINPYMFIAGYKDKPYLELIKVRDKLINTIRQFENNEMSGDRSDPAWMSHPSPAVQYQMNLVYLSLLCKLMHERYNRDYVFGDHSLMNDAEIAD